MPRIGRLHVPGGCYHVIGRGLERRNIFAEVVDKEDFLARLGLSLKKHDARCFAWAIMSNHYHLLIRVSANPLSKLMSPLLTGFAVNYNRRNSRCGYVFQNRFRSILCDEDEYLLSLLRYIHLNPLKARILDGMQALNDYRYTGHAGLLGKYEQPWHTTDHVLQLFSNNRADARQAYQQYIADGMSGQDDADFSGGGLIRSYGGWEAVQFKRREHELRIGDERILGKSDFVNSILKQDVLSIQQQTVNKREGWDLTSLIQAICHYCGIQDHMLLARGRMSQVSRARQLLAHFAITELNLSAVEVASQLRVSLSGVSKMVRKGRDLCRREDISLSRLKRLA